MTVEWQLINRDVKMHVIFMSVELNLFPDNEKGMGESIMKITVTQEWTLGVHPIECHVILDTNLPVLSII